MCGLADNFLEKIYEFVCDCVCAKLQRMCQDNYIEISGVNFIANFKKFSDSSIRPSSP